MEWAIWLTVVLTLLAFPPTRWLIKGFLVASLGLLMLLLWSEPDLSD